MKTLLLAVLLPAASVASAAYAAVTVPTDAQLKACFDKHSQLLEKPWMKNLLTCWRAHGRLSGS